MSVGATGGGDATELGRCQTVKGSTAGLASRSVCHRLLL